MRATHSADRVVGRLSHELSPELARRVVTQRFVRMHAIVMLEPRVELTQDAGRIELRTYPRVIPFEGFDEGFSHAVRLGALDRCRARHQADISCQSAGF